MDEFILFTIIYSSLPKVTLCHVWLKLTKWLLGKFFKVVKDFHCVAIIYSWRNAGKFEFPSPKKTFVLSLVEISPANIEEKTFKKYIYIYYVVPIISPEQMAKPVIWCRLNPLYSKIFCAKFGWNWPSGSGEEVF